MASGDKIGHNRKRSEEKRDDEELGKIWAESDDMVDIGYGSWVSGTYLGGGRFFGLTLYCYALTWIFFEVMPEEDEDAAIVYVYSMEDALREAGYITIHADECYGVAYKEKEE